MKTTRFRECRRCEAQYADLGPGKRNGIPAGFCSQHCYQEYKDPEQPVRKQRSTPLRHGTRTKTRKAISPASTAQREKVAERACVVCREPGCDPAHLIDRSLLTEGQDDPRAVVGLCRGHHRAYDDGQLDLLPYLEPHWREELAFAVERFGLRATYQRVTGGRLDDLESRRAA